MDRKIKSIEEAISVLKSCDDYSTSLLYKQSLNFLLETLQILKDRVEYLEERELGEDI